MPSPEYFELIVIGYCRLFLHLKFLEDTCLFCGATDTPVFLLLVTSVLGFKARVDLLACFLACALFLRFTSGVTNADLLTASMVNSRINLIQQILTEMCTKIRKKLE